MKNITTILPIHELETDEILMLNNALISVGDFHEDVKVTIVHPKELGSKVDQFLIESKGHEKLEVKTLPNTTDETDFVSQVNLGIEDCDTEWFSILEIDDEYRSVWLPSMKEYIEANKDVDVFLPIVRDVNVNGDFMGYMNESVWAYGFSDKQGFLDLDLLMEFQNFQTSGGLYRTEVIKEYGKLKNNIKLTFSYEFLLRLSHRGVKIMTVPKLGYRHVNLRENSLFWRYKNDGDMLIAEDEVKFWLDAAKTEYFFINKREIKYESA
jgi:hypothetical protein